MTCLQVVDTGTTKRIASIARRPLKQGAVGTGPVIIENPVARRVQREQVEYPFVPESTQPMELSVIIVNWNTCQDLLRCLASIYNSPPAVEFEVLVVDNASDDGSVEHVAIEYPQVRLVASLENLGFARANNRAATLARGRYWLLLNPDTVACPGAIDVLLRHLKGQPRAAVVGPRLVNPDGSMQLSIWRRPTLLREWWRLFHLDQLYPLSTYPRRALIAETPQRVDVLHGACLLLRRDCIQPMGLFDEDYFIYSEEIDLCERLGQAGWELYWVPMANVIHTGGQSTRQVADRMFIELHRNKVKFFRKRRGVGVARLYKLVLLQAALTRILLGHAARLLPVPSRQAWMSIGRQYALLLPELSGF